MSDTDKPRRVSIGFEGGQVLAVKLTAEALKTLRGALEDGGWHEVEAEDGVVVLDLGEVVYLRTESDPQRVGFGLG